MTSPPPDPSTRPSAPTPLSPPSGRETHPQPSVGLGHTPDPKSRAVAPGFRASGVTAGLKASGKPDVALITNEGRIRTAAVVTTSNRVCAAPVVWTREVLDDGQIDAVILNSGGANACTGPAGYRDTRDTARHVAAALGTHASRVAVCSTGLIGEPLDMTKIRAGADAAVAALSPDGGMDAARAIMTTDTVTKTVAVTVESASGGSFTVCGMAKGAGMLAPGLATMLVVLTTDAEATAPELEQALTAASRLTFDRLDSDGAMSTNDTVLLMASGASTCRPDGDELRSAVISACDDLAAALLSDAEGATKEIAIEVRRAASEADAVEIGRAVARNNLVKTAFFGEDPNWGRILAAVGTTGAAFDAEALDVAINGVWVCRNCAVGDDRDRVDLTGRAVHVVIDVKAGDRSATIRTNDLSHAYVHENSAYST